MENSNQPKVDWYRRRADGLIRQSRAFELSLNSANAIDTMAEASDDVLRSLGHAKFYERNALLEMLHHGNDELWRLIAKTSLDIPDLRQGFSFMKKAIKHGDDRFESFDRLLFTLEKITETYSGKDRLAPSQRNLLEQLVRESGELLTESYSQEDIYLGVLTHRSKTDTRQLNSPCGSSLTTRTARELAHRPSTQIQS